MAWARLIAMVLACASEICGALLRLVHSAASPIPPTSTTNMKNRMGFRNVTDPAAAACLTVSTFQHRRAPDAGRDLASNGETQRQPNGDGQTNPSSNSDADASADAKPNPDTDAGTNPDTNANPSGTAGIQPRLYDRDGERRVDQRHWQQRRPLHQRAGEQLRTGHPVLRRQPPQPAQLPRAKRGEHVRHQQRLHHLRGDLEQPRRPDRSQWSELEGLYGGDAVSVLCRRRLPLHAEA